MGYEYLYVPVALIIAGITAVSLIDHFLLVPKHLWGMSQLWLDSLVFGFVVLGLAPILLLFSSLIWAQPPLTYQAYVDWLDATLGRAVAPSTMHGILYPILVGAAAWLTIPTLALPVLAFMRLPRQT